MASLKVAVWELVIAIEVAVSVGVTELTVGAVVSGAAPVVKLHTVAEVSALSPKSFTPVETVAVYKVLLAKLLLGLNVAVKPE